MKKLDYLKIIETNLNKEYFTQHGLHMNAAGKEWMVRLIASNIKQTLTRQTPPYTHTHTHTSLKQKKDHMEFSFEEVNSNTQSDSALEFKGIVMRTSRRQ